MKKIVKIMAVMITILPLTLFAHPGHSHDGSALQNFVHFLTTNIYFVIPFLLATYLVYRHFRTSKIKK